MIGIIGAMEEEVQALRHAMKIQEEQEIASMIFHRNYWSNGRGSTGIETCHEDSGRTRNRLYDLS